MFTTTKKYKQAVASRHCYHEMRNEMKKNESKILGKQPY